MGSMGSGTLRADGARSNDDRNSRFNQSTDPFLPQLIRQEWPVAHRAAVNNGSHAFGDE
jgi:hypothetical protein